MGDFDPLAALRVLVDHRVRFIVIGGVASAAHGSPLITQDLDVCYERSPENLERMAAALQHLHAKLRGVEDDVSFILDAKTLKAGDHFTFITDEGDLDIMGTPAGSAGYEDLATEAQEMELDGLTVLVVSLDDLMAMKRAAGRPKDLLALEFLGALRDEISGS
jgi:predicted nucleotidyltransferase